MNKESKRIMNAYKLKEATQRLELAKINAYRASKGLPPLRGWYIDWYIILMHFIKQTLLRICCPCVLYMRRRKRRKICCCKKTSCFALTFVEGTHHNEIFRSFLGFFGGVILSYALFVLISLTFELNMKFAAGIGITLSFVLTIGLAFSPFIRCITMLIIPNFFSSQGRSFLMMYAVVLVMTYPVTNFTNNITVMSDSATCGQGMALNETKQLIKTAASPMASIVDGLRDMLKAISDFAKAMRTAFLALKKAVKEIAAAISRLFSWLHGITDICNENMGEPYKKCKKAFDDAAEDCRDKMGFMDFLCLIVDLVSNLCHIARIGELLCIVVEAIVNFVAEKIGEPINVAINNVRDMFYFNVSLNYHYNVTMIQSQSYADVKKTIMRDVKNQFANINILISAAETVMMFTFLLVFIKALVYRYRFLTKDKYDNVYVTQTIKYIDDKRKKKRLPTILPLRLKERLKYIGTFSLVMTKKEKKKMMKGMLFLFFSAIHAAFYMVCDYSLYWTLLLIRKHLEVKTTAQTPAHLRIHVQGKGAMSDMYRSMISLLDPISEDRLTIDTTPCLPNPGVPNIKVYKIVGGIFAASVVMSILEAYGLRLRHIFAGCFYPHRDQVRAVWLYNRILKLRGNFFFKVAKMMSDRFHGLKSKDTISLTSRIAAKFHTIGRIMKFFGYDRKACMSCGIEGRPDDHETFQHCESPGCKAIYCLECSVDLNNMCTVCMHILDYGEDSSLSEEIDSSDDEFYVWAMRQKAIERRKKIQHFRDMKRTSKTLLAFGKLAGFGAKATASEIMETDLKAGVINSASSSDTSDYKKGRKSDVSSSLTSSVLTPEHLLPVPFNAGLMQGATAMPQPMPDTGFMPQPMPDTVFMPQPMPNNDLMLGPMQEFNVMP